MQFYDSHHDYCIASIDRYCHDILTLILMTKLNIQLVHKTCNTDDNIANTMNNDQQEL